MGTRPVGESRELVETQRSQTAAWTETRSLSIVYPAYNEEACIRDVVRRALEIRPAIVAETGLTRVEIIVVDDGSTDRTAEIVREFGDGVILVQHERNRGYGAALKTGFARSSGELLAFLDADGTCDPLEFVGLCRRLRDQDADLCVGSRMHAASHMPLVRTIGNRIFAVLLGLFSNRVVSDAASGMRLFTRPSLSKLYPLPDGLDFTPAMSARALMNDDLKVVDIPITYAERQGRSKLRVLSDGVRFVRIIVETALTYQPFRILGLSGALLGILGLYYLAYPIEFYARYRHLEEWMFVRLMFVMVALATAVSLVSAAAIAERVVGLLTGTSRTVTFLGSLLRTAFTGGYLAVAAVVLFVAGVLINGGHVLQYLTTRTVDVKHWSYLVAGALCVLVSFQLLVTTILVRIVSLLEARSEYERRASGDGA